MSSVDQQMASRREQILEAARAVIETRGYAALSMRNLAAESGVTVPTIYNLVGNKEAVLFAAVEEQTRGFVGGLERASGDLVEVVVATVRLLVRRPRYYRALLIALANAENADAARRLVGRALEAQISSSVEALHEVGALSSWIDLRVLTERLHARLEAISLEWSRGALTTSGFRAAAMYDVALTMMGITSGNVRSRFEAIAREHQAEAARRGRSASARGRAA